MKFDAIYKTVTREVNLFLYKGVYKNKDVLNNLTNKIKDNLIEKNYNATNVKGHMTSWNLFNNDKDFEIFFRSIVPDIRKLLGPQKGVHVFNSWGNLLNKGEHCVQEHNHQNIDLFSGVLHLSDIGPGLYFKDFDITIKEEVGGFILFHPSCYHEVKNFNYTKPRYSLAFNINKVQFPETE